MARTQTVLTGSPDGGLTFAVQSRKVGAPASTRAWTLHATGRLAAADEAEVTLDLEAIRARCPDEVAGEDFYRRLAERGNDWGPCFRGLARVWRGPDEAIAEVRAPAAVAGDLERYRFHPALADAAGHALAATIPLERSAGPRGGAFVGGALDRFVSAGRRRAGSSRTPGAATSVAPATCWRATCGSSTRRAPSWPRCRARASGTSTKACRGRRGHARSSALRHRVASRRWRRPPLPVTSGGWCSPTVTGSAPRWRRDWRSAGSVLVEPGERYEQRQPDRFLVRPGDRDDVRRLLADVFGGAGCAGIVHLWSLDGKVGPDATAADLDAAQRLGCGSILPSCRSWRRPGGPAGSRSGS